MSFFEPLYDEHLVTSSKQWKQHIQFLLQGEEYRSYFQFPHAQELETKAFYHPETDGLECAKFPTFVPKTTVTLYVNQTTTTCSFARKFTAKGVQALRLIIPASFDDMENLLRKLPQQVELFIEPQFLNEQRLSVWGKLLEHTPQKATILIDPMHQLTATGNFFNTYTTDFASCKKLLAEQSPCNIQLDTTIYQNAGASIVQQLAFALGHLNEYLNFGVYPKQELPIVVGIGSNFFFEMAKIKAFHTLVQQVLNTYGIELPIKIIARSSHRNKSAYHFAKNTQLLWIEGLIAHFSGVYAYECLSADFITKKSHFKSTYKTVKRFKSLQKNVFSVSSNISYA